MNINHLGNNHFFKMGGQRKKIVKRTVTNTSEKQNIITKKPENILQSSSLMQNVETNHYKKINGISEILWINLDRSEERRLHMEQELSHIDIPNTRIQAIDGKIEEDLFQYIYTHDKIPNVNDGSTRLITQYEIACTLSHLKAIHHLKTVQGDYFLILEDDITFENMKYIPFDLNTIIQESPPFDILQIFTNSYDNEKWVGNNSNYARSNLCTGTVGYIISRNGINTITEKFPIVNNILQKKISELSLADELLYIHCNSYQYKYALLEMLNKDSTIHPDHIDFQKKSQQKNRERIIDDLIYRELLVFRVGADPGRATKKKSIRPLGNCALNYAT